MRGEGEWSIARTDYRKLYLDAGAGTLRDTPPETEAAVTYGALGSGPGSHRATFEHVFAEDTEVTGHMKLKLFASTDKGDDMDIFAGLYKFDADGHFVLLAYCTYFEDGPVALDWIRGSHRELDPLRSTEYQPYLRHARERKPKAGVPVELDIEIWPSSTRFEAGSRLRLIVQGTDLQEYSRVGHPVYARREDTANHGDHTLHTGGSNGAYLLIPGFPPR